jgi:hypothetical protein
VQIVRSRQVIAELLDTVFTVLLLSALLTSFLTLIINHYGITLMQQLLVS